MTTGSHSKKERLVDEAEMLRLRKEDTCTFSEIVTDGRGEWLWLWLYDLI